MRRLDEAVGQSNWQREHKCVDGHWFCRVGIKIDGEWIWKEDAGSESNFEAEKGAASDSFKRACTNWGIGRELYDYPTIKVQGKAKISIHNIGNGKLTTMMTERLNGCAAWMAKGNVYLASRESAR